MIYFQICTMFPIKSCKNIINRNCRKFALQCCMRQSNSHQDSVLWTKPVGHETGIKIFNPILKEKVDLVLKNKDVATWYSCGPTVYDSAHIGHASCYVRFDIIRRILEEWFNINVIMVMGITDIDDKIIKRSLETNVNAKSLAKKYEVEFFNDLQNLNVMKPSLFTRVSDHIGDIITFIDKIIAEGYAYVVPSGSVYFKTSKYGRYNIFCVPSPEKSNIELNDSKQSSLDFALWKSAKPDEPSWKSPWGDGRPGWHIECSAMASTVFGSNIDLHSGGIDLKFPHHENEEAQSCAHHRTKRWVNYWMHSGHLRVVEGEKMSKSLKNTLTIEEFLNTYSADEFRLMCLMSRYRSSFEYTDSSMKNASTMYKKIKSFLHFCDGYIKGQLVCGSVDETVLLKVLEKTTNDLRLMLSDDFNTPKALASLLNLISVANTMMNEKTETIVRSPLAIAAVSNFINEVFSKWGLSLLQSNKAEVSDNAFLSNILDTAIEFRCKVKQAIKSGGKNVSEDAKKQRDELFECCDGFRNSLNDLGIQLDDHKEKSFWSFKDDNLKEEISITKKEINS